VQYVPVNSLVLAADAECAEIKAIVTAQASNSQENKSSSNTSSSSSSSKPLSVTTNNNSTSQKIPVTPSASSKPAEKRVSSLPSVSVFYASDADELGFKEGDVIKLLTWPEDSDWWTGELNGKSGQFPKTYVTMQNDNEVEGQVEGNDKVEHSVSRSTREKGKIIFFCLACRTLFVSFLLSSSSVDTDNAMAISASISASTLQAVNKPIEEAPKAEEQHEQTPTAAGPCFVSLFLRLL
jgi:hypothetical protein